VSITIGVDLVARQQHKAQGFGRVVSSQGALSIDAIEYRAAMFICG
jgi:hypothetical protein